MALIVNTSSPNELQKELTEKIINSKIDTWEFDEDGDFTHSPEQWRYKAWIHEPVYSKKNKNQLIFGIIGNKEVTMTKSLYAVYHGRFAEMLLSHFDEIIDNIEITAEKTEYDYFR